ncbi:MAG TPA: hypothetical protein VMT37_02175 [Solirubrobacterales bacterium]|nr:hypothetical protein [Solirubrobacterales bacterium]
MAFIELTPQMTIGELVVGLGTLALAGFTAWLARRTSAEVHISEEQMRLSRESIEALDRPFLVLTHYSREPGIGITQNLLLLRAENLGRGPALFESVRVRLIGRDARVELGENPLKGSIKVIPVKDGWDFRVPLKEPLNEGMRFTTEAFYRSPSAREYMTLSDLRVLSNGGLEFIGHRRLNLR